ncbi:insulinase family protein [Ekhidna sp.]|uniref:insulinase family protein n=1 Tax=Ekhidna sp. TaxID=2608089 RepID=UPI003BA9D4A6
MKNILSIIVLIGFAATSFAQNPEQTIKVFDRSKAPDPAPAKKIEIGSYDSFTLPNGLEVFVVEDKDAVRVSFQLSLLKNGPLMEGDLAGVGAITGELLENGTKSRSATDIEDEIDFIGANLQSYDGGIFGSSLKKYQDNLLEIMSDVLLNPSFPTDKLDKIKKRRMSNLLANSDDPNVISNKVVRSANYTREHPYGEQTTATTISNIDKEKCVEHYQKYYKPNAGYLVMVGNISLDEAKEAANKYFADWEKGELNSNTDVDGGVVPSENKILLVDREQSEQSVIDITYPINDLKPGTDEALTASVMNSILGGGNARLFNNLREDKGYTYGAYSRLSSDEYVGSFSASASVRNEVTTEALTEFFNEMEKIRDEPVPQEELDFTINKVAGSFARSLESPQTIANFAINTARYDLPDDYYQTYLQRLKDITVDDIQASAQKYIKPEQANIVIVGKGEEIADGLTEFGEIVNYDKEGEVIETVDLSTLSVDDTTPEEVIANYIKAIGGSDKVRAINTLVMKCSSSSGEFNLIRKGPNKATNSLINGEKMVFRTIINGEKASMVTQDGPRPLDLTTITKMRYASRIHEEVFYGDPGWKFKTKLKDVEEVNGKACYKVQILTPSGDRVTKYYDAQSGLLIKEKSPFKGTITYENYKKVEGIMFPHKISVEKSMLYGTYSTVVTSIEINIEVTDFFFRIF